MVMADISGRDRGQRRTRFPRKGPPFENFVSRPQPDKDAPMPVKTPVILTKPQTATQVSGSVNSEETSGKIENHQNLKTPSKLLVNNNHVKQNRPGILPADGYHLQQQMQLQDQGPRLVLPPEMVQSIKIIDEQMWMDSANDWLLDQPDFLVIGVLGMQGVGKSTILSHVAGCGPNQAQKSFVFKPQNRDAVRNGGHMTYGIDMYVTEERTILLDSQALVSPSVLDTLIYQEKKCPSEYSLVENAAEIQSLKITSFMLSVCNVVLVAVDWFLDENLFNFLRMAEMLKPLINSSTCAEGPAGLDKNEYFPEMVFVFNKANDADFRPVNRTEMCKVLAKRMANSKLRYTGMPIDCKGVLPQPPQATGKAVKVPAARDLINFVILPKKKTSVPQKDKGEKKTFLTGFSGHPGFDELVKDLSYRLLAAPRHLPPPAATSEKSWFHYAGRVWEFLKRSPMMSEYNRLLS